jgi:beta-barrel assembly-enhancing protease
MNYNALAYGDEFEDGREAGSIKIEGDKLIFFNEKIELFILKKDLKIELGGTANRQIFLKSNTSNIKFSTADNQLLKHDFFVKDGDLSNASKEIQKSKNITKATIYAALALFLVGIFAVILSRKAIVKTLAKGVPNSVEETLGSGYIAQLKLTSSLDTSSEAYHILNKKIQLLTLKLNSRQQFKTYIVDADDVNAFALPGGFMVFNSALLKKADSWEEVLGVASHEIAHVTENHHTRGVLSNIGIFTVLSLMFGDGSAMTDLLFGAGASLENLSYSRDFESEADVKGFEYLYNAKINPKGLRIFFGKLEKESKIASAIPEFISTHPSNVNRIEEIKNLENSLPKGIEFLKQEDYKLFKIELSKKPK